MGDPARIDTLVIHGGQSPEPVTGAVMPPVFQTSTYAQPGPGEGAWEYSRTHNPTRQALERAIASLEGGEHGLAFSSGMAAIDTVLRTLSPGDRVMSSDDVYGGTYRLFTRVYQPWGLHFDFTDLSRPDVQVPVGTKLVWIESPTNPLLKTCAIERLAERARAVGAWVVVDNTFATPICQRPLDSGAHVVIHSTTKYLGGHSDVVGGAIVTSDAELAERFTVLQNAVGAVPGPWDCFLTLRGIKTLAVRMARHQANARALADWLAMRSDVEAVHYPGFGGMVSFVLRGDLAAARRFVTATRIFTLAESLGGVESLIELPALMTHASVPSDVRRAIGLADGLIRLSVGIEHIEDLRADLDQAFKVAAG